MKAGHLVHKINMEGTNTQFGDILFLSSSLVGKQPKDVTFFSVSVCCMLPRLILTQNALRYYDIESVLLSIRTVSTALKLLLH